MKKTLTVASIVSIMLLSTACGGTSDTNTTSKTAEVTPATTETATTEVPEITTEEPISNVIGLKETGTISNWDITINKISFVDKVSENEFLAFSPDTEGSKFLVVELKAENIGKKAEQFLPSFSFDDITATLLFGDGFEFSMTNLLGYSKSLMDATINPLSSQNGVIAFEVPEKVYNSKDKLTLQFSAGDEELIVNLR